MITEFSFTVQFSHNLEDLNEKVDYIQVQFDGRDNVFLWRNSSHDHVGVIDDESCNFITQ